LFFLFFSNGARSSRSMSADNKRLLLYLALQPFWIRLGCLSLFCRFVNYLISKPITHKSSTAWISSIQNSKQMHRLGGVSPQCKTQSGKRSSYEKSSWDK